MLAWEWLHEKLSSFDFIGMILWKANCGLVGCLSTCQIMSYLMSKCKHLLRYIFYNNRLIIQVFVINPYLGE